MAFTISPKARADLDGIRDYTAERWDADQADRYIRRLAKVFGEIADESIPGRVANDVRQGYFNCRPALTWSSIALTRRATSS